MVEMPLQCGRMAQVATEYCGLIDVFEHDVAWRSRLGRLLPRLHVAVVALVVPQMMCASYRFPDDDARCELYMRLYGVLQADAGLCAACDEWHLRARLCDRLADDLADMYFELKCGLGWLKDDPMQAASSWQYSFYLHWSRHLLDAEHWLRMVDGGAEPQSLPEVLWPRLPCLADCS
jgi:hypothetical protein